MPRYMYRRYGGFTFNIVTNVILYQVHRINWCQGYWCGSTYMVVTLSDERSKTGKKCILPCFRPYVGLPDNHIGWAISMPFASIYPSYPRTNPWKFGDKALRICSFENLSFFWVGHFVFFFSANICLLHTHKHQSEYKG